MKSKAPLVMMEQIIMVLIFALASALCLQAFVLSGKISKRTEAENRAALEAQNAAETMKAGGINGYKENYVPIEKAGIYINYYNKNWNPVPEESGAEYCMEVVWEESDFLWKAELTVKDREGEILFRIPVAGQMEVMQHE